MHDLEQLSRDHTFAQSMRDRGELQAEGLFDLRLHRAEYALFADGDAEPPPAHRLVTATSAGDTFTLMSREAWSNLDDGTLSQALRAPDLRCRVQTLRDALRDQTAVGAFSIIAARFA